ncbi:MAG: hypothetical protein PQ612_06865 [Rickettsiales bacterium]|nr:hypothetical protein [Pseudomonadota bacterium]MDA0966697.1 hypothetical protein [Pseudomonadota bacterium]MDG4543724.1 hypothetical protein [Rickettsiales bacterium]MDG4545871.1 hypothetical protein [Rickettsiales bacterium]MDG4547354.1 hypothetical protein [Rickettsiales bacterium]
MLQRKNALTNHHRQQREDLLKQQKQRRIANQQQNHHRLPSGLRTIWSRITGQNDKIRTEIRENLQQETTRNQTEKQALIQKQLTERGKLQKQINTFRQNAKQELTHLRKTTANAIKTGQTPEHLQIPQKAIEHNNTMKM